MPNHKSAEKRVRQTAKKTAVNKANKSQLRTQIKKLRSALTSHNKEQSQELLVSTVALIDKSVNKGVLHKNTAARYKSRLTLHVNNLSK